MIEAAMRLRRKVKASGKASRNDKDDGKPFIQETLKNEKN